MIKRKFSIMILFFFLLTFVSALDPQFIFEKNSNSTLIFTCNNGLTNDRCDSSFSCDINVNYPDGKTLFNGTSTTRIGDGLYSLNLTNLTKNGFYIYNAFCTNGISNGTSDDLFFKVTESGQIFSASQGITSLGIILSILGLTFFFLFFGYKFTNNSKTYVLALIFVTISIFLVIYVFQLGLTYIVDILEYQELAESQTVIYNTFLFIITFVGVISFILMMVNFLKELSKKNMKNKFGDNFDPISQTYQ